MRKKKVGKWKKKKKKEKKNSAFTVTIERLRVSQHRHSYY